MRTSQKHLVLFAASLVTGAYTSTSHALENYQTEFALEYYSSEDADNNETKAYGLTAEIYFSEIDTTGHPYAEAAFLERAGSVALLAGKADMKSGSTVDADGPLYHAMVTYIAPESPIAVQASIGGSKYDYDPPFDGNVKTTIYGLGLGYFISDGLLASIDYMRKTTDYTIPVIAVDESYKNNDYELGLKYVKEQPDGTAINIEGKLGRDQFEYGANKDTNTITGISGDYYFNRRNSLGGGLEINAGDNNANEGVTYTMALTSFVNPAISVHVEVEKFIANNDQASDSDSLSFRISSRF